ncbi:MAG: hypothetical protein GX418_13200 [Clostridiales bacterium]|nr:hypothetical protein [Clostridiales bacterium]
MTSEEYRSVFFTVHADKYLYLKRWYHTDPFWVSPERDAEFARFGLLMHRCVQSLAERYESFNDTMQLPPRTLRILRMLHGRPYRPGTFRPDLLLCADGGWRACEITSRFMYSGYYASCFTDRAAEQMAAERGIADRGDPMTPMFGYAMRELEPCRTVSVIKSDDRPEALKLYQPYFEALGKQVTVIPFEAYAADPSLADADLVISEIKQTDLWLLSDDQIRRLVDRPYLQDLRTAFLPHDKRFFALLQDDAFTGPILTREETAFLRDHIVITYVYGAAPDVWADARARKDAYILKHARLGKSEKVFAGCTLTPEAWDALFAGEDIREMVLQPYMAQRRFETFWEGQRFVEYAVATILLFDDRYFGPGLIRSSSHPVTNQGDDRKFVPILTMHPEKLGAYHVL